MNSEGFKRRLSAILSADVAGYSRLMGENDQATVNTLTGHRQMISTIIDQHQGRVVDSPGDNLLAEFESVIHSVECAVEIQRELAERNAELPVNRRMDYRIGVNVGDVIKEGDRVYGDGVNIAARLESLAEPGGICISGIAYTHIKNKLKLEYEFLGKQSVKNINEPVPVYCIKSLGKAAIQSGMDQDPISILSDKPSIAVLPFVNMSKDPDTDYFSDGMAEEIIGALAKLDGLKVISRTSSFYFKGQHVDLGTVGAKLKVDHVLEGSVRKAGSRVRISAQLIRVADDTHLWAETYDRDLEDVFAIQDEISKAVVQSLKAKLLGAGTQSLVKDYSKSTAAYELYLRGRFMQTKGTSPKWLQKANNYFKKAVKTDPQFGPAYSQLAMVHYEYAILLSLNPGPMWSKTRALALKALAIDAMDSDAHAYMGIIKAVFDHNWTGAEKNFKRAIELNPGNNQAHFYYAIDYFIGINRPDEAIKELQITLELDPYNILYNGLLSGVFNQARLHDEAIAQARKTLELAPNDPLAHQTLAVAYACQGRYADGIAALQPLKGIPFMRAQLGYIYGKAGKKKEAQEILVELLERSKKGYFSPFYIAMIYAGQGNNDKAFAWLEKSIESRFTIHHFMTTAPHFEHMHSDPRWSQLMRKMGLAD